MKKKFSLILISIVLFSCSTFNLPDSNPSHQSEVKSDCKSWIKVWVRDPGKIVSITRFDHIDSLQQLDLKLREINVFAPLSALRYKRIAERRKEPPLSEKEVVDEFILAARDLSG